MEFQAQPKEKIAAIVPALNEEMNIARVLKVLLESKELDEVIVVDDGSTDRTAKISRELGAKVISLPKKGGSGKGNAMKEGVKSTEGDVILFCDADLIGLSKQHISQLLGPVLRNEVVMSVGMRERSRWGKGWGKFVEFLIKINPISAIGGERAIKRYVFEAVPERFIEGFMIESALNHCCESNNLPVTYVKLKGVHHIIKEKKWGLKEGFQQRLKLIWQVLKVRFQIIIYVQKNQP